MPAARGWRCQLAGAETVLDERIAQFSIVNLFGNVERDLRRQLRDDFAPDSPQVANA